MNLTRTNDAIVGAAAGVIATVPMTITMEQLHRVTPDDEHRPLPPREVTEGFVERFAPDGGRDEESLQRLTFLLHYAFGGVAGALFPLVAPRRVGAAVGAGVAYGLAVWSGSYLGLLPAIGVRHNAKDDSAARSSIMIAAHVVWGITLALLVRGRPGVRTSSRNPDLAEP
jgi:hypothetical protein